MDNQSPALHLEPDAEAYWGNRLKVARLAKQLSEETVATQLKLSVKTLRALEEDNWHALTLSPMFVRGYLKNYSELLGIEMPESVLASIQDNKQLKAVSHISEPFTVSDAKGVSVKWLLWGFVAAILFIGWQFDLWAMLIESVMRLFSVLE
ncbi:MAG: helix-turn-helix domain-containing protein [Thiotrichales bacterium]|jgi:cytoskeletal protein RodZ|nr:helix-turn-helix domain-containing protein [Thiotrichales bacterium]